MTKALAKEFGGRGICVNAVCPGTRECDVMLCGAIQYHVTLCNMPPFSDLSNNHVPHAFYLSLC
jgi:NAD(P)-dependent dehydrogenase (short-subunit alcohol dehydrogenase family)